MAAVTHLDTKADTTPTNPYPSNSFTPTAGSLLVVLATVSGTVVNGTCTASANGLTFSFVNRAIHNTSANSTMVYVANQLVPASPVAMTVTVDVTADPGTGAVVHVAQVSGMTAVGSAAIRQSTKQDNGTGGTTPAPVFASAALTGNPTMVVLGQVSGVATTAPVGWTKLGEGSYATPTIGSAYVARDSGFTGTTITWGTTSTAFGDVAVELDASAPATSSPEARRVVRRHRIRNPVSGVLRGVAVSETPPRQLFPVRSYRRPMRRVAPRTSGSFVSPPPVAPTPPTLVPDLRRSRVKGARVAKGRPLFVPPTQAAPVAPTFVPSVMSRRVRGLLRRRVGKAEAVAPQQTVPFPVAVARRVLRGLPARRSRKTEHIPHQPGAAANHFTAVRRTLRGIVSRRVRRVEVVPAQVVVAPPTYVPTASQRRTLHGLLARRGRRPEVVPPQQAAPVNPDLVHRVSQRRTVRGLLSRRGRRPEVVPAQATPATPVLVLRPALRRTVRGVASRRARRTQPIPPQTSPIQQTARRVRVVAVRRLRRIGAALGQAIAVIPTYGQMFNHKTTAPTAKDHDITVPKAADHDAAGPTMRGL